MNYTNQISTRLAPSETLAIKARAMELKAQGKSIIDLCAGEPDIDTPEHIKQAAAQALREGKTKYTNVAGIAELRQALVEKLARENGIHSDAGSIVLTNGGKQALHEFFEVVLEPGDEVIIPAPYWVSYPPMVELAGGRAVPVKTSPDQGYKLTPDQLEQAISPKTKCLVLNSPSNPTGSGYSAKQLAELAHVLEKRRVLVISDEVYEKLVFGNFEFSSFVQAAPAMADRTVTVGAFSKSYSMTGWRAGYAVGPKQIIDAIVKFQSQTTSNISTIAQYAALAALKGPQDFIAAMIRNFERRMALAMDIIQQTPGLRIDKRPEGAFYLFVRFDELSSSLARANIRGSTQFINYLLDSVGVATVPGEAFGDDGGIRVSIAASDESVVKGLERIRDAVVRIVS